MNENEQRSEHSLREIFVEVLTDGIISREEVDGLRKLLERPDGIDKTEADLLFELHTQSAREMNHPSWQTFFIGAIVTYLYSSSSGMRSITDEKAHWLLEKLSDELTGDQTIALLLNRLSHEAIVIPEMLRPVLTSISL